MRVRGVALVAVLVAAAASGQEPPSVSPFWQARGYEQWTAAETIQLLTNSPWNRPASLVEPGAEVHLGKMQYYIQWYSARVIREGLVRLQHLKGRTDPSGEAQFLAAASPGYQLYIFGAFFTETGGLRVVPAQALEELTREEVAQGARLLFSSQEYAARPDLVEFVRDADTRQVMGLRLTFQRARAAVPPEQALRGQVQLVCPTRRGTLSARFQLDEMHRNGRPDL